MFQLLYETKTHVVKEVTCGIDPGRENVGIALILPHKNDPPEAIMLAHLETNNKDVPRLMSERRKHRHQRREHRRVRRKRRAIKRKTSLSQPLIRRYPGFKTGSMTVTVIKNNEPRFLNRRRPEGWITPTVRHLVQGHLGALRRLAKYYPIGKIVFELPKFALMRLEDGSVQGVDFQNGRLKGYQNVKEYVRSRDNNLCVHCGQEAQEVHHISARHKNGSDLPENLVCLCKECHTKLYAGELSGATLADGMFKKYHHLSVLNVAAPYIYKELVQMYGKEKVQVISGKETSIFRQLHKIQKTHSLDAACIAYLGLKAEPGFRA